MISSYTDLLKAADAEPEPQRLLFVFCRAELPDDASEAERAGFANGEGGALTPVVCVDKAPEEVSNFEALVDESRQTGQAWDVVFVAAMSGRGGTAPSSDEAQQPLTMMVESIRLGHVGNYLPLDSKGQAVALG
ncbi:ribonucleotide reductase subunit alpha [Marinobacter vulgaris]|uniref:Ribonucleotide reductase subunit alpha n=1 Tax=Marinobacter vulgaris TaxID=1928331 RepID=A0A2V3ZQV3_9GAMM|nr:ribonucleotide reductase subunit alpha [Marinobacter vulgaris]PXX93742.1 ribonucleotide reductase subunit alpha [Marinobacter vulgaris]TSJ72240.1 ribonucleotide reductase subunit alpha [Marinobacter vulgaris]